MSQAVAKQADDKTLFGFWVYILTDCVVFACLFATFAVLRFNTYGGPGAEKLFSLPFVFAETILLLTSSFTCGLAVLSARANNAKQTLLLLAATFVLGLGFVSMELSEFSSLFHESNGWDRSGFLSAFFTLVGTHGLHITIGLIWIATMGWLIYRRGLGRNVVRKLLLFSLFWHFLDIVWIFIFTIVYLLGVTL
jgi:cytochrome o ubiquinol oxidase subunit 3